MCKQHALRIAWTIARSIAFLDFRVLRWKFTYDWKCVNTTYRVPLFMPTACFPEGPSPPFTFCSFWRRRQRLEAVLECQTVWIQIQPEFLLEQIWVQKQFANNICTIKRCYWLVKKFKAISFIKTIIISNSLDEGQEQYSVWPDLDPNCLDSFLASKSWYYMYMYMCLFVNPCHAALGWVLLKTL